MKLYAFLAALLAVPALSSAQYRVNRGIEDFPELAPIEISQANDWGVFDKFTITTALLLFDVEYYGNTPLLTRFSVFANTVEDKVGERLYFGTGTSTDQGPVAGSSFGFKASKSASTPVRPLAAKNARTKASGSAIGGKLASTRSISF